MDYGFVRQRVEEVRARVEMACRPSGRHPADVRVVAVTKTASPDVLSALYAAGIRDAGENRWQIARDKLAHPASAQFEWHFIGALQTNKVKYVVPRFSWIHSLDRPELARALSAEAVRRGAVLNVLVQVNISGEAQKHGIRPEDAEDLILLARELPGLSVRGLMTMAPIAERPEDVRHVFAGLRALRDDLQSRLSLEAFDQLSMGMSDDFEVAVQEGATMIRIGRRLVNP
ncbi:YggS family pyridoxal phosphate-dependent enzyme [Alicyclobacillus mali]|uniref:Pyridoxal phosphate homeostasis protein n=1 Tax=Alicyclobacillus mali (ex Roth et al. 2021) TaxID=1123961 RepID=A0ABS0F2Q4_9BACL|nr:YggS family pyridoxal phosphate-dependent enzyme [Alicyclobacillus mali (ex Roth et al. 2021)]MBF8377584.1 YggS family pyridoxal phosphate-dependent enzyme [Alicyclobacillus mali (ex Roth et al. 2021)]MCL6488800.1 YggS family pyridoxal phosphate-dependent enzyme [Alicyclobacillus mali (ex Roth et al. 2021)]